MKHLTLRLTILSLTSLLILLVNAELTPIPPREIRTSQRTSQLLPPRWIALPEGGESKVVLHYNNRGIDAEYYEVQRKLPMWRWVTKGKALPSETTWTDVKPSKDWAKYRMRAIAGNRKGEWNKPITFYP